ncbi:MAG: PAS domain-containing sensor histidine kinase [Caldisericia bacterium]|nr:PAS domain-containing sensor histidine kinase [Caldisericia bacterium]
MSLIANQLRESNDYLNLILNTINSALFLVNQKAEVESFNDSFHALFNRPEDEIIGKLCGNAIGCIYTVEENKPCGSTSNCHKCALRHCIEETLSTKKSVYKQKLERVFVITGKTYKKHFQFSTHYITNDVTNHVLIVLEDVTELVDKNIGLNKLNQQKNELLGMVAHDLRNPLATIQMYSSFLQNAPSDIIQSGQGKELLTTIQDTSDFMLHLLDDVLNVSSIESGQITLHKKKQDFISFLEKTVKKQKMIANKKGIQLRVKLHDQKCELAFDPVKMEQVTNNLLSNAIKYSNQGTTITVEAKVLEDWCEVHVIDQGVGVKESEQKKLFKPFSKTSNKATSGEKSTGLGLYLAKRIIEEHGGIIDVKSSYLHGSDFYFQIPLSLNLHNLCVTKCSNGTTSLVRC